jgi:hypothetical protein
LRINASSVGQAFWTAASSGVLQLVGRKSIRHFDHKTGWNNAGSPFDSMESPLASAASTALMASYTTEAAPPPVAGAVVVAGGVDVVVAAATAVVAVGPGEAALEEGRC